MNSVPGFSIDSTNVVSAPANSELAIFTTDNALPIIEAKVKTTTDAFVDLVKQNTNSFSLAGLPVGVYTLDVITQKGNTRAAYEGILVLGQQPTNPQTRTIIEQQITKEDDDEDEGEGNGENCDPSYPGVCIPPYPPDLNCGDIQDKNFRVSPPDPHDFDREGDGIGCEDGSADGLVGEDDDVESDEEENDQPEEDSDENEEDSEDSNDEGNNDGEDANENNGDENDNDNEDNDDEPVNFGPDGPVD